MEHFIFTYLLCISQIGSLLPMVRLTGIIIMPQYFVSKIMFLWKELFHVEKGLVLFVCFSHFIVICIYLYQ